MQLNGAEIRWPARPPNNIPPLYILSFFHSVFWVNNRLYYEVLKYIAICCAAFGCICTELLSHYHNDGLCFCSLVFACFTCTKSSFFCYKVSLSSWHFTSFDVKDFEFNVQIHSSHWKGGFCIRCEHPWIKAGNLHFFLINSLKCVMVNSWKETEEKFAASKCFRKCDQIEPHRP